MMRAICGWCKVDLGWRQGPEGEVTHGICASCKRVQEEDFMRSMSGLQKVAVLAGFIGLLLLFGVAGEMDRQDALRAAAFSPGPPWGLNYQSSVAVGWGWPGSLARGEAHPQYGVHAAAVLRQDAVEALALGRGVFPSSPPGVFSGGSDDY